CPRSGASPPVPSGGAPARVPPGSGAWPAAAGRSVVPTSPAPRRAAGASTRLVRRGARAPASRAASRRSRRTRWAARATPPGGRRHNDLKGTAFLNREGGAQRLMAGDDRVEGAAQSAAIEGPADPPRQRDVVKRASRFQAVEEPEPLLGEGGRARPRDRTPRD